MLRPTGCESSAGYGSEVPTDDMRLRVLLSAGRVGGPGGAQRAVASTLRALEVDDVDVVARTVVDQEGGILGTGRLWSNRDRRWAGSNSTVGRKAPIAAVLNPLRRWIFPQYDVHIRLYQGAEVNRAVRSKVRVLVPSGNPVSEVQAAPYDYVALQAPDNQLLVSDATPTTLLPPPLFPLSDMSRAPSTRVPDEFYLTAFNPYGPIKGTDDLAREVESSPLPIVWCHSARGVASQIPAALRDHPRVIHVVDPGVEELRWLYERCAAYLCFSKTEGFGWSIADGLRYTPVVVSRDVGILTHPSAARLPGIIRVDDDWQLDWSTLPTSRGPMPVRDLSFQSPESFRDALVALVDTQT
jgi:hypothetical protein